MGASMRRLANVKSGRRTVAAAGLAALLAASCASTQTAWPPDYIGPAAAAPADAPKPALAATEVLAAESKPPSADKAAPGAAPAPAAAPAPQPLEFGVQEAILMAMENNRSLAVERLQPPIRRTFEREEWAAFDPVFAAEATVGREQQENVPRNPGDPRRTDSNAAGLSGSLSVFTPTGTTVAVEARTDVLDSTLYSDDVVSSRLGLSVTQALLRGAGVRVNLVNVRQARVDALASEYELRGFTEALAAGVEEAYWDYAVTMRRLDIFIGSLALAEKQKAETQDRISAGKLAESELAAADAEVALRRELLINARSQLATLGLVLRRLLNPSGGNLWDRPIVLKDQPAAPAVALEDVARHVEVALAMRPDLNQARLQVQRGDLEIIRTRNGLLPRLDVFLTLGRTGYADSVGESFKRFVTGSSYDVLAGVQFEYPPANQAARARHSRALLTRQQAFEAVGNLAQLVEADVRGAYIEVNRAREQIPATAASRQFEEEKVRAETEKFRVGKSTSLLVAQAQRDLLASQIAEVEAVTAYLKALVGLYRLEGSLLERRGVAAPGRAPVSPDRPIN
jgi:outer membrane protein TolC